MVKEKRVLVVFTFLAGDAKFVLRKLKALTAKTARNAHTFIWVSTKILVLKFV